jgi:hypothetical protein
MGPKTLSASELVVCSECCQRHCDCGKTSLLVDPADLELYLWSRSIAWTRVQISEPCNGFRFWILFPLQSQVVFFLYGF